jgi:hypothetical protein
MPLDCKALVFRDALPEELLTALSLQITQVRAYSIGRTQRPNPRPNPSEG